MDLAVGDFGSTGVAGSGLCEANHAVFANLGISIGHTAHDRLGAAVGGLISAGCLEVAGGTVGAELFVSGIMSHAAINTFDAGVGAVGC